VLSVRNIDSYLDDALRHSVDNSDLLMPASFRHELTGAAGILQAMAKAGGRNAKVYALAAQLLEEEESLRDLLLTYRTALLAG